MAEALNLHDLRGWIGREDVAEDILTPSLAERFHATLSLPGAPPAVGEAAPRLIHFCLCQPAVPMSELGEDGHPARGGFLPPVPLPRRMWAGSQLTFHGDILVGSRIRRLARIADVAVKSGRSGTLCFVTVDHRVETSGVLSVEERQTIVYREAAAPGGGPSKEPEPAAQGSTILSIEPSPLLLFRYSALTFNGHRIHYDKAYATGVEGYPGLVVHGPLQATLLYHLAARERGGQPPRHFEFRSVSTIFDTDVMNCHAATRDADSMKVWTSRTGGPVAMQAEARWA